MARDITSLLGQKFGKLLVLSFFGIDKRNRSLWLVLCDCGKEIVVRGDQLTAKNNPKKHCGCETFQNCSNRCERVTKKPKDLPKQKFGKLTVLKFLEFNKNFNAIYLVECDCGNKIVVEGYRLTRKNKPMIHCGCLSSQLRSKAHKGISINVKHGKSRTKEYDIEQQHNRRLRLKNSSKNSFIYSGSFKKSRSKLDFCVYCESTHKLTTDHIIPIRYGGNNDPKNLVTSCQSCNSSKRALFFIDWYLKTTRVKRSLPDILKDMGFDSIIHLQNYQDSLCPEHIEKDPNVRFHKLVEAEMKDINKIIDLL